VLCIYLFGQGAEGQGQREIYTAYSRTPSYQFWFYQTISSMLKMGTESVPVTSENPPILTQLSVWQQTFSLNSVDAKASRLISLS